MALFKRNKDDVTTEEPLMPAELQEYYQTQNRERSWMAWLLGLLTLVVTVAIALGLFYGGRYAYRKIRNNDTKQTAVQTEEQPKDSTDEDKKDEEPKPAATPAPATTSNPSTTPSTSNTPGAATSSPSSLTNTGPADTLTIFVVVSLVAYVMHRRFSASR